MDRMKTEGRTVTEFERVPQPVPVESDPEKNLWWVWLLVFAAIGGGGYYYYTRYYSVTAKDAKPGGPPAVRETPVVTATARRGDMKRYLTGLGSVTALNTVTLHTRVDGQLDKVAFVEGQLVHKNDLLAEIDPRPYQVQLIQAQGQLAKDKALYDNATADLQRYTDAGGSISKQERDTQQSLVNQSKAAMEIDKGQIANVNLQLTYCRITAPITGVIGLRLVDQGNIVHMNDQNGLAVITQLQPISVVFTIPEDDLSRVLPKMRPDAPLPVNAYDRGLKVMLATGTLQAIDNQIDQTNASIKLKAVFPNEDSALYPNQFVNARVLVDTLKNVVLVPAAAVQRSPTSTFVYIVKPDKTVDLRNIELGPIEGDVVSIASGLDGGELVVTDGVDKLQQGFKVSTTRPAGSGATTRPKAATTTTKSL